MLQHLRFCPFLETRAKTKAPNQLRISAFIVNLRSLLVLRKGLLLLVSLIVVIAIAAGAGNIFLQKRSPAFTLTSENRNSTQGSSSPTSFSQSSSTFFTTSVSSSLPSYSTTYSMPSCGSNTELFSTLPVSKANIVEVTPLGQVVPPAGHVFPAPHQYIYVIDAKHPQNRSATIYAPGNMTLKQLVIRHYNVLGQRSNFNTYTLVFYPCAEFALYFHNVINLSYPPFVDAAQKLLRTCSLSTEQN